MIKNKINTYLTDEGVVFEYIIWECDGDYYTKPYYVIEIDKMIYEDKDVTDLLFNIADKYVYNIRTKIEEEEKIR